MEENDPKPIEAAAAAAEGQRQPESSPGGGSGGGGGGGGSPGDADTGRRRALMLPAVLQAPGNHQHPHRITNFFIDNILRPEFGRRKDAGTCCAGAGGGRGGGAGGEGGAGGAEGGGGGAGGAEQLLGSGREARQNAPGAPGAGGPLPGGGGGGGGGDSPGDGEGGSKALSLHGGAKKGGDAGGPLDGALKARGLGGGDLSVSSDSDSSQASANLGAQPMLWPAWVYCTRYSDRPSSVQTQDPCAAHLRPRLALRPSYPRRSQGRKSKAPGSSFHPWAWAEEGGAGDRDRDGHRGALRPVSVARAHGEGARHPS
uniref:Engrailed homeobox 2 n=1 Tax=Felis catus TaxID=9685 RepID=A0ABI7VQB8_FELCA